MDDVHQVDDQKGGERRKEDAMKSTSLIMTLILGMSGFVGAGTFSMKFKKAELKNQFGSIAPGAKGELIVDSEKIRFEEENGNGHFKIPTCSVTNIFYTRVSARRVIEPTAITSGAFAGMIAAAAKETSAAITIPVGLAGIIISAIFSASKGHKHYMVLVFKQPGGQGGEAREGAVEFKLDKKNYRACLRAIEQVTCEAILYGQEGIEASEHKFPERRPSDTKKGADKPKSSGPCCGAGLQGDGLKTNARQKQ